MSKEGLCNKRHPTRWNWACSLDLNHKGEHRAHENGDPDLPYYGWPNAESPSDEIFKAKVAFGTAYLQAVAICCSTIPSPEEVANESNHYVKALLAQFKEDRNS